MLLSLVMCLSVFAGLSTPAFAATDVTDEVYMLSFPREGDANYDHTGSWGHDELHFMNGWRSAATYYTNIRAMGSFEGNICYCIEPGVSQNIGDVLTGKGEDFWINYPSEYNRTIEPYEIKQFIGRIMQYGYTGAINDSWRSQNEGGDKLAHAVATQLLIWEAIVGERDSDFDRVSTGGSNAILETVRATHPLYSQIMSYYSSIEASVKKHTVLPSFCAKTTGKAQSVELEWDGSQYTATLTDNNQVLGNYTFAADVSGVSFSVSGNQLTITAQEAPDRTVTISAEKNSSMRRGVITWSDGVFGPNGRLQDVVTFAEEVSDPVKGFVKIEVSFGSAKIVKISEDGKVAGIKFTVTGDGYSQTFTTDSSGSFTADNLKPGVYNVTEQSYDDYDPQEPQAVTVVSGQTATVTFSNTLRRGDLEVIKTAEDNMVEGVKFHLYGTADCGSPVDEYAVTDASGVAIFKGVLIGSGYTLEEVGTPDRYVIPDQQTAAVEWNKVTHKTVDNRLKKWNLILTKQDSETGTAQGDATLAGAKYGVFHGEELIDSYVTDADGKFTTKYYVCGPGWSVKELESSEGYLVTPGSEQLGVDPKTYTAEYNSESLKVDEQVVKGKIAIIKHTDDGETKIETPEVGAEFAVYLKSAGSFDGAKESERDYLVCDENGFAETKLLPYGRYVVQQVKGWDGRELLKPFDVFVCKDGETYRYLINNAEFRSYVKVVKVDSTTGKIIPCSGIGFQIYDPDGNKVEMTFTYPSVTTIDTFYTDADGMLITPERLGYGKGYSLVEVSAPYGYVLNSDPVYFDITEDNATEESAVQVVVVEKENTPQMGRITVEKTGECFATVVESKGIIRPLYEVGGMAGAEYTVTAAEDIYTLDGTLRYSKDEVVATLVTQKDGKAVTEPLYLGKFHVVETKAPYGMLLNSAVQTVELTYAGQEVEITETSTGFFNERQKVKIELHKVMEKNSVFGIGSDKEITAVTFGLYAAEDLVSASGMTIPKDCLMEIVSCDENGYACFSVDLPVGAKAYVKEISTDSHYILSDEIYPVAFEYAGQEVVTVYIDANGGKEIPNDLIYGTVKGYKVDRETDEAIRGALFGLFRADETSFTEDTAILTAESGEDGVFTFENIVYGNFAVRELRPAEGYLENEVVYPVTVSKNGNVVEITVENDKVPEIGTTATVAGEKEVYATEIFTLTDTVAYKHLVPGKEYTLSGILVNKATGAAFRENGKDITAEVVFVPETPSGSIEVQFSFDARLIKEDTDIVVFEYLFSGGKELCFHADLKDAGQTVTVKTPKIGTKATAEGKKEITTAEKVTIEDTVAYINLTPGKEYVLRGTLMDKATGKAFQVNGESINSTVSFTPEKSNGEVKVTFTFDASGITKSTELVVFETLYRGDVDIAVHADINSADQTVKLTPPTPDVPQTGDNSNLGLWIGLGGVALGGAIGFAIMFFKKKKDGED